MRIARRCGGIPTRPQIEDASGVVQRPPIRAPAGRGHAARYRVRMSNREVDEQSAPPGEPDGEDTSSPFDHPAFLPVIVGAFALWFGYDGWFNTETESVLFNRYGFGFLAGAAAYFALDEFARRPYLLPALWLGYAVWLGALAMLGAPGDWYYDGGPYTQFFNRYGSLSCLGIATLLALGQRWRRRGAATASAAR